MSSGDIKVDSLPIWLSGNGIKDFDALRCQQRRYDGRMYASKEYDNEMNRCLRFDDC